MGKFHCPKAVFIIHRNFSTLWYFLFFHFKTGVVTGPSEIGRSRLKRAFSDVQGGHPGGLQDVVSYAEDSRLTRFYFLIRNVLRAQNI